jgi:hypothetical protein
VVVERRRGDAGVIGDLTNPCCGVATGGEEADGGIANASSGIGIPLGYRSID